MSNDEHGAAGQDEAVDAVAEQVEGSDFEVNFDPEGLGAEGEDSAPDPFADRPEGDAAGADDPEAEAIEPDADPEEPPESTTPASGTAALWKRPLVLVGAAVVLIAVVVAGFFVLRPSDDDGSQTTAAMLEGVDPVAATEAGGGACGGEQTAGRQMCQVDGVAFMLAPNTWEAQAGERERECLSKTMSNLTKVLTNGSWMVYADDERGLLRIKAVLEVHGAPAAVRGYCEYDVG